MAHCVECGSSVTLPCHVLEYKYVLCILHCEYMEHAVLLTIITERFSEVNCFRSNSGVRSRFAHALNDFRVTKYPFSANIRKLQSQTDGSLQE